MTSATEPKESEVSAYRCRADHSQPTELRTRGTIHRKLIVALAAVIALPVTVAMEIPASASTVASASSLAKDVLPSSYANNVGFTQVAEKVATYKTGNTSCPFAAQEEFENAKGTLRLISGAATCTTSQGALKNARSGTSATSASPPKQLGSSAIERSSPGSIYEIYWLRGLTLEVVEIASVSPTSSRHRPPIAAAQQQILSNAAVEQNRLLG
jgi:hypothetical protein